MKKILGIFAITMIAAATLSMTSCQSCTRHTGGTTTINLEKGEKLVEATWKEDNIWYLVEPMEEGYAPKTKVFKESSNLGIIEGKVIFVESR